MGNQILKKPNVLLGHGIKLIRSEVFLESAKLLFLPRRNLLDLPIPPWKLHTRQVHPENLEIVSSLVTLVIQAKWGAV